MQLTHYNTKFKPFTFPITLVCDNVSNGPNIGSLFRIADAFGVQTLILCGQNISMGRKMTKTSRATEKKVNYKMEPYTLPVVERLKKEGALIITLEITSTSRPLHAFEFSNDNPIALIVGDETLGVSEPIIKGSDVNIHIDMFGSNSSMNVVQATNIALYEITKQLRGF
ncbi:TrmH family RNA methyltransferase [Aestuariivivens sediminis]|uniref:TrmH family RNA methyltransferase n=1 Tax=Aestuariivivens sediminis TaxID=2913557 RepID=UPI001F55FE18|nr:TrmH family RNA methyltransferase [Aestuariivivens sediminis]